MSVKSVNALSHYTDWTIGHVHGGALGWVAFMTFGMLYWLAPRIFQTKELWSKRLATLHFWLGTIGIVLYVVSMWIAGITQGLMWRAFDSTGRLAYPDFVETVTKLMPMYYVRAAGGALFLVGILLLAYNILMTWRMRPSKYAEVVNEAPALAKNYVEPPPPKTELEKSGAPVAELGIKVERLLKGYWHRKWEGLPLTLTVMTALAVITASLFEILPTFLIKSNVPTIASVKPYTPLELLGRDIYLREGCYNCHSQMIRPFISETVRYGEYSKPGEFVYDHPFQWGSRRIGPDLARESKEVSKTPRSHLWHVRHFRDPRETSKGSIMPPYPWLLTDKLDLSVLRARMDAMVMLGVPYGAQELQGGTTLAQAQAKQIAAEIAADGGPKGLEDKEVIAMIAYLQRLGSDIKVKTPAAPAPAKAAPAPAKAAPAPAAPAPAKAPPAKAAPAPAKAPPAKAAPAPAKAPPTKAAPRKAGVR